MIRYVASGGKAARTRGYTMNAGLKLGLAAIGVGTVAAATTLGGMAIDASRGDRFNASLTPGTSLAMAGLAPGFALAFGTVRSPGPASAAFMGATLLGAGVGALIGRSTVGFAPAPGPSQA